MPDEDRPAWRLVIHGGAGVIERSRLSPAEDRAIRAALDRALAAGAAILAGGGSALDAVEAAVRVLEDDPHFNAGRGSVFTYEGTIEMDASIMDGSNRNAGAVTGVTATRNPISLARRVMEHSPHVFLSREGADQFSREQGLPQAPPEYFQTEERRRQLEELRARPAAEHFDVHLKYGTVGAVAMDQEGHVAAATSTGGLTGKRWGRIGDSPIIGAGTYADDRGCAVSSTGAGRIFHPRRRRPRNLRQIRALPAAIREAQASVPNDEGNPTFMVHASEMRWPATCRRSPTRDRRDGGARRLGGVIVATPWGDGVYSFNTPGMYRGMASPAGRSVAIYGDEDAPDDPPSAACPARPARALARLRLVGLWPRNGGAGRLVERRTADARRAEPADGAVAPARHADLPGADDRGGQRLARLHQAARRQVQLRRVLALSECRHLPAVRPRRGLPRRQLRVGPDRAQPASARRPPPCRRASG